MEDEKQTIYTVKEVAEMLKVHFQTILAYIKDGKLMAMKIGKGYRISKKDLDDFLEKSKTN